jgi:hypothetical protein
MGRWGDRLKKKWHETEKECVNVLQTSGPFIHYICKNYLSVASLSSVKSDKT